MGARLQATPGRRSGRSVGAQPGPRGSGGRLAAVLVLTIVLVVALGWLSGSLEYGVWWLTNARPPSIGLAGPSGVVRGSAEVGVELSPGDRAHLVEAWVDGRPLALGSPLTIDTAALPDGVHRLLVVVEDRSLRRNQASAELELRSDNTPPQLAVESRPAAVSQGHSWLLRVRADEPAAIQASLGGKPLPLQADTGIGWAIMGFGPDAAPTEIPLVVTAVDAVGNRAEQQAALSVVAARFTQDRVEVSANLVPLLQPQVRADEDARLAPTYTRVSPARLWEGPFMMPTQGQVVTEFGEVRSYNGGPFEGHHGGTDFAAPTGRPVVAPARGKVVIVDRLRLRGNVVILDHGLGVFTTFAHLSAVDVQVGQEVQRGQPFAKVGSTGLSEGPHLHWELWVGGVNVDPMEWVAQNFP